MVQSCILPKVYLDLKNRPLAQPMRVLGHSGEISSLLENTNWICAREESKGMPLSSELDLDEEDSGGLKKARGIRDLVIYESIDNIVWSKLCD